MISDLLRLAVILVWKREQEREKIATKNLARSSRNQRLKEKKTTNEHKFTLMRENQDWRNRGIDSHKKHKNAI